MCRMISQLASPPVSTLLLLLVLVFPFFVPVINGADFDYKEALSKSILFFEAQRSGKIPSSSSSSSSSSSRLPWRGDSGLDDGDLAKVDLVGGYYDAGDNVKFGFPMAFSITVLSWGGIFYRDELKASGELENLRDAVKWGTDYFLKAAHRKNVFYAQVGDAYEDHHCWIRPENMKTKRSVLVVDEKTPGTEIVAETAAALASASILFRKSDYPYSVKLIRRAKRLFDFANSFKGSFNGACPFYCSHSGFNDEILWAATWLYIATLKPMYLQYIEQSQSDGVNEFSWDLKYAGAQVLLSKLYFEGRKSLERFKIQADSFVCSVIRDSPSRQVYITPGGMIYIRDGANTQYVTGAALLFSIYSDRLAQFNQSVTCNNMQFHSTQLMAFAKQQMDYLLGENPQGRSYMVGFGENPPRQAHHRGSSVPKLPKNYQVNCPRSFDEWFHRNEPNPNQLTGAIVGGPDRNDAFTDQRSQSSMTEPTTYINAPAVAVLAKLAASRSLS